MPSALCQIVYNTNRDICLIMYGEYDIAFRGVQDASHFRWSFLTDKPEGLILLQMCDFNTAGTPKVVTL